MSINENEKELLLTLYKEKMKYLTEYDKIY